MQRFHFNPFYVGLCILHKYYVHNLFTICFTGTPPECCAIRPNRLYNLIIRSIAFWVESLISCQASVISFTSGTAMLRLIDRTCRQSLIIITTYIFTIYIKKHQETVKNNMYVYVWCSCKFPGRHVFFVL